MNILDLKPEELVLILGNLNTKKIGKASFVCRKFKDASDRALASAKYVKFQSRSEKLAVAQINKLRSIKTFVNNCEDSVRIAQALALNCPKIENLIGFLPQHALLYVRAIRSRGETVRLKKLVIVELKGDLRIKTIEMLMEEVPALKLGVTVGHSKGQLLDVNQVFTDYILAKTELLSIRKIPWDAVGKLPSLKEFETAMSSEIYDPIALDNLFESSKCKLEKISLHWSTMDILQLFNHHLTTLKEVSFFNYEDQIDEETVMKFNNFIDQYGSLATPSKKRKLFASFECPLNVGDLLNTIESSCKNVDLLIHTSHSAVIQQVDLKNRSNLRKCLGHVKFGNFAGRDILDLLKSNLRIFMIGNEAFFVERTM